MRNSSFVLLLLVGLNAFLGECKTLREEEKQKLISIGKDTMREFKALLKREDWLDREEDELTGIKVLGLNITLPNGRIKEIYQAKFTTDQPQGLLFKIAHTYQSEVTDWQPAVKLYKKVQTIDGTTFVSFQQLEPVGLPVQLPKRNFVTVQRAELDFVKGRKPGYLIAMVSLRENEYEHPSIPVPTDPEITRGTVHSGSGMSISPDPNNPSRTLVRWIQVLDMDYEISPSIAHVVQIFEQHQAILGAENMIQRAKKVARDVRAGKRKF